METSTGEFTRLLKDCSAGNREALDRLLPLVCEELRRLAHSFLTHERSDLTLQTTALVHEAYLKLIDQRSVNWENRAQFFAISAQAMRRILVALDATNVEYPDDLAESLMLTGESLVASGNSTRAIDFFQEARAMREPIVAAHQQRIDYRRGLARLYTDMGNAFVVLNNRSEAGTWYRKGLDLWNEMQNQHALWAKEINMPKDVAADLSRVQSAEPQKRLP